jgi:uncharacterized membrane protein
MTANETIKKPKVRLKFIDMARSIAILLMLEGHFVDDTLLEVYRDDSNMIYYTWKFIRSFTAAVFLTVTGLIFVYLLLKNREESWFKNIRIRKGFKRVVELLFWGMLVQWYAFHVLECISAGILSILILYGLYKLIRVIPLWVYFFIGGVLAFGFQPYIKDVHDGITFIENGWMNFLQWVYNPERNSVHWFPVIPFVGFTMFGAMIGALLHDFHKNVKTLYFPLFFTVIGAILFFFGKTLLGQLDILIDSFAPHWDYKFIRIDWLIERLGMVSMGLSVLMYIDTIWGDRINGNNLFLKVGQNTLTIYVLHMIVLYGSVTTFGLNDLFNKGDHSWMHLNPWQVALGAALFIAFFVLLIKYLDWIKARLEFILGPIRNFFNRLFLVR